MGGVWEGVWEGCVGGCVGVGAHGESLNWIEF